ncbi:MAG: Outer membrane protein assembly factor BamA [bacterium]|nr:Outer membrane protein assembly factor BamA [bacterium]
MRLRFFFFIILSFLLPASAWAQTDTVAVIDSSFSPPPIVFNPPIARIFVSGNRHTKPQVILREMQTQVGDTLDIATLQADQKRILNLGLFNRVELDSLHSPEGVHLLIGVSERLYLFPFPVFFLNDKDWGKASYGAGLVHTNFRGRNEIFAVSGWAGYNPAFAIDYSNPWLFGPAQMLTRFRFAVQRTRNRSFEKLGQEVDENRLSASWSLGKRFGLFTYLNLSLGYTQLKLDSPTPALDSLVQERTLDPSGRDRLPSAGLSFVYDRRDLFEYPRSGVYVKVWGLRTGFNSEYVHFWRYGADVRGYKRLYRNVSIGARAMTDLAQNNLPIYERVFLGYTNRVRGHFTHADDKDEGENLTLASAELRFPILPWHYFSVHDVPAFASYLQNMKFGISAGIFADYGRVWFQDLPPDGSRRVLPPRFGYGAGLHFHLPYINLLRLELAFNEDGQREWFTDIGVAF